MYHCLFFGYTSASTACYSSEYLRMLQNNRWKTKNAKTADMVSIMLRSARQNSRNSLRARRQPSLLLPRGIIRSMFQNPPSFLSMCVLSLIVATVRLEKCALRRVYVQMDQIRMSPIIPKISNLAYLTTSLSKMPQYCFQNLTSSRLAGGRRKTDSATMQHTMNTSKQQMKPQTTCMDKIYISADQLSFFLVKDHQFELQMNVTHKCHFHPEQTITKFCSDKQCTLPLCALCENIHLEEHQNQAHPAKLIRFNEAYLHAINDIEDFLERQRKVVKERGQQMEKDRENVLKYIDNYYSNAAKMIEEMKGKCHQVQDKLSKLKKGSIKTLIFYYSGDIQLKDQIHLFEPLINCFKTLEQHNNQHKNNISRSISPINILEQHKENEKRQNNETISVKKMQEEGVKKIQQSNALQAAEQLKIGQRNREKTRKSIFQHTKRSTITQHPQNREHEQKYHYNKNPNISQQSSVTQTVPTFNELPKTFNDVHRGYYDEHKVLNDQPRTWDDNNRARNELQKNKDTYDYKLTQLPLTVCNKQQKPANYSYQPQPPVSFQNRYGNKFSGNQQYEAYKKQRQQKVFKDLTYHNRSIQQKQNIAVKNLKPTDFETDRLREAYQNHATPIQNGTVKSPLNSQRLRSVSQTAFSNRDIRDNRDVREVGKEAIGYDLKKQVLAPQQIRKMLQKRIQERNRILSIKKGQNVVGGGNQRQTNRKIWQTKDSIINQIYNDTKY